MDKEKEILKESLLAYDRASKRTRREINVCTFMEEVTDLSGDKEKALSKLNECANYLKTLDNLCDTAIKELEKSTTDFSLIETYCKSMDHTASQLMDSIESYNSLRKKPVEKED